MIGNDKPTRDFNYVSNTVDALIETSKSDKSVGEVINFGSGVETSIRDLVNKIIPLLGKDVKIFQDKKRFRPDKSEVFRLVADNTKAKKLLGWKPKVDLNEGLSRTIEWISNNLDLYKANLYNK